jgi:hypothetical protein
MNSRSSSSVKAIPRSDKRAPSAETSDVEKPAAKMPSPHRSGDARPDDRPARRQGAAAGLADALGAENRLERVGGGLAVADGE